MIDKENFGLRIFIWGDISSAQPRIEYFAHDEWDKAIQRALDISKVDEPISRIQVIDAWGMLIAQFTHRRVIL